MESVCRVAFFRGWCVVEVKRSWVFWRHVVAMKSPDSRRVGKKFVTAGHRHQHSRRARSPEEDSLAWKW